MKRLPASLTCVIALILNAPGVNAESPDDRNLFTLNLEELLNIKVVTPQANESPLKQAPAAVSVFTAEDIRRLGVSYLYELVNLVPGFSSYRLANSGSHYSLVSRGFKTGAASREVLVLWNGMRLNGDATGGYQFSNRQLSLDNVKRIEFLRGPASTVYGSNAFLGVVNIITDQQDFVSVSVGANHAKSTVVSKSLPIGATHHQLFAKYDEDDGENIRTFDGRIDQWLDNTDPHSNKEAWWQFESEWIDTWLRWVSRDSTDFYVNSRAGFDTNRWKSEHWLLGAKYDQSMSNNYHMRIQFQANRETTNVSRTESIQPLRWSLNKFADREIGINLRIDKSELDYSWFSGLEVRRATIDTAVLYPDATASFSFPVARESHRTITGLFAEYNGQLSPSLDYIAGARWDDYSEGSHHLSPRFGLLFHPTENHTIKLLADDAFRAPTRIEKDPVNSPRVIGNPDLMPEVAKNVELVYLWQTNNDLFSTSIFDTQIRDIIKTVQLPGSHALTRVNQDKVSIAGLELEWQKNWTDKLHTRINATWLFDTAHNPSPESDKLLGLSISYTTDKSDWNLNANYQGARDNFNQFSTTRFPIAGRTLVNTNWRYYFSEKLNLSVRIDNLLDESYVSPSQNNLVPFGVPNRGREWQVGLKYSL